MITGDFKDYSYRFTNKEQFQDWSREHCNVCWGNGFGSCEICKQNQAIIEKAFEEMVGEE